MSLIFAAIMGILEKIKNLYVDFSLKIMIGMKNRENRRKLKRKKKLEDDKLGKPK